MIYFIVNTTSRTGKAEKIWNSIKEELHRREIEYEAFLTLYEGHAGKLAEEISEKPEKEIRLVIVGGDGTVNEAVNGIRDFERVLLGYIPTGSGNDLGRGLRLPKDPREVLDRILSDKYRRKMDLGSVKTEESEKERYFTISSGVGVDADVCKEALHSRLKRFLNYFGLGKLTYLLLTIKRIFTMPALSAKMIMDNGMTIDYKDVVFIAAMNHYAEGGGIPMAPKADAFDGRFDVCVFWGHNRLHTLLLFPLLILAKQSLVKRFEIINCDSFSLTMKDPVVLHADGEYGGTVREMQFKCHHEKLNILV